MRFLLASLGFVAVGLLLSGCPGSTTSYDKLTVGEVNEDGPQVDAAILVGDPQVFSRETLINDRLREVAHLDDLLRKSRDETFEPQLMRDLAFVQALSAQLGISFNPSLGTSFQRRDEAEEIKSEIEVLKLRNELERLRTLMEEQPDSSDLDPGDTKPGTTPGIQDPSTAEIKTMLANAIERADATLQALATSAKAGARARAPSVRPSPEERFEDLNAYRAVLRQRQTEVALDDVHDAGGNTLYRLQFTATVLPGQIKNKFGVLEMEIEPSRPSDIEMAQLYEDWLITLNLSGLERKEGAEALAWERAQSVLIRKDIVERVLLEDVPLVDGRTATLPLFVFPEDAEILRIIFDERRHLLWERRDPELGLVFDPTETKLPSSDAPFYLEKREDDVAGHACAVKSTNELSAGQAEDVQRVLDQTSAVDTSKRSIRALEIFLSSLLTNNAGQHVRVPTRTHIEGLNALLLERFLNAQRMQQMIVDGLMDNELSHPDCARPSAARLVPRAFFDELVRSKEGSWIGKAYTYQAQPTSRVQRISTLSSAVNSLEAAFSIAATLPVQGVGVQAGAGAARSAVGIAEAIERTPLVIGYTDRQKSTPSPRFGFVFGPRAILDPESRELEYRHVAGSHAVYVDVSVPAWWSSMKLLVKSAWAANWHVGSQALKSNAAWREITVRLRPQRSDFEALTGYLAEQRLIGAFQSVYIESVDPKTVSACIGDVEFVIKGKDLWRGATAFLRGQRHQKLAVLPDMGGIAVTFNMTGLPKPAEAESAAYLKVWTSFGFAQPSDGNPFGERIDIVNTLNGRPCPNAGSAGGISTVSAAGSRLLGTAGQTVRVNLDRSLPADALEPKVIVQLRPKNEPQYREIKVASDNKRFRGRYVEGKVGLTKPADVPTDAANGAPVRVGLQFKRGENGEIDKVWAGRTLVYYPSANESKFKIETAEIADLPADIVFEPPAEMAAAYPGFDATVGAFAASIDGHDKISLSVRADWGANPGKVLLRVDKLAGDAEAEKAFLKQWCTSDRNLTISLTGDGSVEGPAIPAKVKLKRRQADDCPS